jgi:prevent-host-death family protein
MDTCIPAGEFKNRCLRILDDIGTTGLPVTITKRGKPVARLVPIPLSGESDDLEGAILFQDDDLFSTGEQWEAGNG